MFTNYQKLRIASRILLNELKVCFGRVPTNFFLISALCSFLSSFFFYFKGNKHTGILTGQLTPTFLILGIYQRFMRLAGF